MGERTRLTHRQRERGGENRENAKKVEPKKVESGGIDLRQARGEIKKLKKELGSKVVDFVIELDELDNLFIKMKKKDGDPTGLQLKFQAALQAVRDNAANVGVVVGSSDVVVDNGVAEKSDKKEKVGDDVGERLAAKMGLDKDIVIKAEIDLRREEATKEWDKWDKKEGIFTLPDGSKIEMRGGGLLGYCDPHFRRGRDKEWFDGAINFVYKYRKRDRGGRLEGGRGEERARIRILFRGAQAEKFEVNIAIGEQELGAKFGKGLDELKQILLDARKHVGEEVEKNFSNGKPTDRNARNVVSQKAPDVEPAVEEGVVDSETAPTPAQEARERAKGEPLVKNEEVGECLKYLWVRRELRKRWENKSDRADWLQQNPLDKMGLSQALVEQIKKDFGLEPILTVDYGGVQFGQKRKLMPVSGTEEAVDDGKGNRKEKEIIVSDEEETADLTEAEKEAAKQRWAKPVEAKKKETTKEPIAPVAEKIETQHFLEKKEDKEDRKSIEHYRYLSTRKDLDRPETWTDAIKRVMVVLAAESGGVVKERGVENNGLVKLRNPELPTLIISDIHARRQSLLSILEIKADDSGKTFFDYLKEGKINVVCLGDGMHSEERGRKRWEKAMQDGFSVRKSIAADGEEEIFMSPKADSMEMNAEMVESLNTMRMIMDLKTAFSDNFHFLRGNHDDILGEDIALFKKYAEESIMTYEWAKKNMGDDFVLDYARFEHSLPLALTAKYFVASHSGPKEPFTAAQIKAKEPATMEGMTFTANDDIVADKGKLEKMLAELLPDCEQDERRWFIGHRVISASWVVQNLGSSKERSPFYQLNNPEQLSFAVFQPGEMGTTGLGDGLLLKGMGAFYDSSTKEEGGRTVPKKRHYLYTAPNETELPPEEPTLDFVADKVLFAKK